MEKSEIITVLTELITKCQPNFSAETLSNDMNIRTDFDLDSIRIMEMIGEIEDRFDIEIPDRKLRELQTVGQIIAFIEEQD